jgi:hypothetical protein
MAGTMADYYLAHSVCPTCGQDDIERTCIGYVFYDIEKFKDENRATCACGWKGIVHDLQPLEYPCVRYAFGRQSEQKQKETGRLKLPVNYEELNGRQRKRVREEYIRVQKNLCCHCNEPLSDKAADFVLSKRIDESLFPSGFFDWPVHLHHSHDTGLTIGAVHSHCNAVLWQYHGQ